MLFVIMSRTWPRWPAPPFTSEHGGTWQTTLRSAIGLLWSASARHRRWSWSGSGWIQRFGGSQTAVLEMASITECCVAGCSHNDHSGCHAFAVTIGGSGAAAECATFIPLSAKGGLSKVVGHVGACQRVDCAHNESLECSAASVRIGAGSDTADCLTFLPR